MNVGSPPQVRGKPVGYHYTNGVDRITPAGAGKTLIPRIQPRCIWDHPRRCGENPACRISSRHESGSPPQVRGKRHIVLSGTNNPRITPAGAGKTRTAFCRYLGTKDHPRRCGENIEALPQIINSIGSPPQVRGKRSLKPASILSKGITPAGAGKTQIASLQGMNSLDHPRRCGENSSFSQPPRQNTGSPPQVRGKPPYSLDRTA